MPSIVSIVTWANEFYSIVTLRLGRTNRKVVNWDEVLIYIRATKLNDISHYPALFCLAHHQQRISFKGFCRLDFRMDSVYVRSGFNFQFQTKRVIVLVEIPDRRPYATRCVFKLKNVGFYLFLLQNVPQKMRD